MDSLFLLSSFYYNCNFIIIFILPSSSFPSASIRPANFRFIHLCSEVWGGRAFGWLMSQSGRAAPYFNYSTRTTTFPAVRGSHYYRLQSVFEFSIPGCWGWGHIRLCCRRTGWRLSESHFWNSCPFSANLTLKPGLFCFRVLVALETVDSNFRLAYAASPELGVSTAFLITVDWKFSSAACSANMRNCYVWTRNRRFAR